MAHTNGIESFWAMLKRAHKGTFHKLSPKHLQRYVSEFAYRLARRSASVARARSASASAGSPLPAPVTVAHACGGVAGLRSGVPVGVGVFCLLHAVAVASLFAVEREAAIVRIGRAFLALRQTPLVARARLARQWNNIARVLEKVQRWIERTET